jgi:hypothetical protein
VEQVDRRTFVDLAALQSSQQTPGVEATDPRARSRIHSGLVFHGVLKSTIHATRQHDSTANGDRRVESAPRLTLRAASSAGLRFAGPELRHTVPRGADQEFQMRLRF